MVWLKWLAIGVATLAALWVVLSVYGTWRWQVRTAGLLSALSAARVPGPSGRYDPAMLAGLPRRCSASLVPR